MTSRLKQTVAVVQRLAATVSAAPLLLLVAFTLPCPMRGAANIGSIGVLCPVQRFVHLSCPGCGITRSVVATAHGQLFTAILFHPVGPFVFAWIVCAAVNRIPAVRKKLPDMSPGLLDTLMALGVVVLIGVWVLRLLRVIPGPTASG